MRSSTRWACVLVAALWAGGQARGNIVNGDFSAGFGASGWQQGPVNGAGTIAEIAGGELHLRLEQTIQWDDGEDEWLDVSGSFLSVIQHVPAEAGFYAPPGTTGLQFGARVALAIDGQPASGDTGIAVTVTYFFDDGISSGEIRQPAPGAWNLQAGDTSYLVPMPDLVPDSPPMRIEVFGGLLEHIPDSLARDEQHTVSVEAWLDDFQFAVIPEPTPLITGSIALGLVGSAVRRRTRRPGA